MKPAEFEEREYEGPLYNQLERGQAMLWHPGQVLEGRIGFDRALMVQELEVWRAIGLSRVPSGAVLGRYLWPPWWGPGNLRRPLPNFKLNLFLQAKRSHFSPRAPRAASKMGLKGETWAFFLDAKQQLLLECLSHKTQRRAHVAYAAPVFHEQSDLYWHTRKRTIVKNSTFPSAKCLSGHKAWYYQQEGSVGVANPNPELIEEASLMDRLRYLVEEDRDRSEPDDLPLESLDERVQAVVGDEQLRESFQRARYFDELQEIDRLADQFDLQPTARAYLRVKTFAQIFDLTWFVVSAESR
jgi:hypothetical protein